MEYLYADSDFKFLGGEGFSCGFKYHQKAQ
jgi:hypothetical protein